jgi:signal peptidase I
MTALWVLWLVYLLAFFIDLLYVQPWRQRKAALRHEHHEAGALSFGLRAALPVFTVVLLLRSFAIDVYHVPSGSMRPLLEEGSRIWVNRLAFGVRSPLTGHALIAAKTPQRGQVVVFQYPREPRTTYVKRILGVPGDHIEIAGGQIRLNGSELVAASGAGPIRQALIGDVHYQVLEASLPITAPDVDLIVPPGHYFTLGDNLGNSEDSRYWGLLQESNLLGSVIL